MAFNNLAVFNILQEGAGFIIAMKKYLDYQFFLSYFQVQYFLCL